MILSDYIRIVEGEKWIREDDVKEFIKTLLNDMGHSKGCDCCEGWKSFIKRKAGDKLIGDEEE